MASLPAVDTLHIWCGMSSAFSPALYRVNSTSPPGVVQRPGTFHGEGYGRLFVPTANTTTTYVSVPNNIYFINDAKGTSFYADTVLIWRWVWTPTATLYVPNTWSMSDTPAVTGSGTTAVEVISWTGGDKRLGINAAGSRRVLIDVTNLTIYAGNMSDTLGGYYHTNAPYYYMALETVFNAWRASTLQMETYAHVSSAGAFSIAGGLDGFTYDQAGIEAL